MKPKPLVELKNFTVPLRAMVFFLWLERDADEHLPLRNAEASTFTLQTSELRADGNRLEQPT
jgi:hypothetical protein